MQPGTTSGARRSSSVFPPPTGIGAKSPTALPARRSGSEISCSAWAWRGLSRLTQGRLKRDLHSHRGFSRANLEVYSDTSRPRSSGVGSGRVGSSSTRRKSREDDTAGPLRTASIVANWEICALGSGQISRSRNFERRDIKSAGHVQGFELNS